MIALDPMNPLRRMALAEARDPVENAFLAFMALPDDGRAAMVAMFNSHQEKRQQSARLVLA